MAIALDEAGELEAAPPALAAGNFACVAWYGIEQSSPPLVG
jgi:hypothetical protein